MFPRSLNTLTAVGASAPGCKYGILVVMPIRYSCHGSLAGGAPLSKSCSDPISDNGRTKGSGVFRGNSGDTVRNSERPSPLRVMRRVLTAAVNLDCLPT